MSLHHATVEWRRLGAEFDYKAYDRGHWLSFGVLVVFLLLLDLCVFHRRDHAPSVGNGPGAIAFTRM